MGKAEATGDSNLPPSKLLSKLSTAVGRTVIRILAIGPIPEHIAIIMDGNRRYADRFGWERHRGHVHGYNQLIKTLRHCWELGVRYVTVYAFSIDNFSRSREEVDTLMNLLADKLNELMTKDSLLKEYGVRVQLLGDLDLLPENVQAAAQRVMAATMNNNQVVLNLCVAYTATAEIVHAVEVTRNDVMAMGQRGHPDANEALINGTHEQLCGRGSEVARDSYICDAQPLSGRPGSSAVRGKHNADASAVQASNVKAGEMTVLNGDTFVDAERRARESEQSVGGRRGVSLLDQDRPKVAGESVGETDCNVHYEDEGASSGRSKAELDALLASVTVRSLEDRLYTAGCPAPDILLRTSGETRLSNFMLWQCCSDSRLVFCNVLWPDFELRHLSLIIFEYQRAFSAMQRQKDGQRRLLERRN